MPLAVIFYELFKVVNRRATREVSAVAEVALCLGLLIMGVNAAKWRERAATRG